MTIPGKKPNKTQKYQVSVLCRNLHKASPSICIQNSSVSRRPYQPHHFSSPLTPLSIEHHQVPPHHVPCGPCSRTHLPRHSAHISASQSCWVCLPLSTPMPVQRKAACFGRHANLCPINLTPLSLSFSPRDLCIPSVLRKLSSKSMTVKVSSGLNPCKLYGLSSPGISMVSAVSPLLKLPRMLHNHFQLPSCSLTQGYNSDCQPLSSRGSSGSCSACLGSSLHTELHVLGGRDGVLVPCMVALCSGALQGAKARALHVRPPRTETRRQGSAAVTCPRSDPQHSPNDPLVCQYVQQEQCSTLQTTSLSTDSIIPIIERKKPVPGFCAACTGKYTLLYLGTMFCWQRRLVCFLKPPILYLHCEAK